MLSSNPEPTQGEREMLVEDYVDAILDMLALVDGAQFTQTPDGWLRAAPDRCPLDLLGQFLFPRRLCTWAWFCMSVEIPTRAQDAAAQLIDAADDPNSPLRPRLLAALGLTKAAA